jgi:putative ABC transport system permease protein
MHAIRNLGRQKRRSFLLGGAIAFGILIVTFVNGFAGGLAANLEQNFSQLLGGEIFIQGVEKRASGQRVELVNDDAALVAAITDSRIPVRSITKNSTFIGTFFFHNNSAVQAVVGVDFTASSPLRSRLSLAEGSFDGMADPAGIIIGRQTAQRLKAQAGDTVLVQLRTITGQMNIAEFHVAAVSHDPGLSVSFAAYANRAYVNAQENLPPDAYQQLGILLRNPGETDAAAAELSRALSESVMLLPPLPKATGGTMMGSMLRQHNENPMGAMMADLMKQAGEGSYQGTRYRLSTIDDILGRLQLPQVIGAINGISFAILVILFLIIVVGVINTFRIILNERTREIGTMRALGMQRSGVRALLLLEALFLFLGGAAAGLIGAGVLMTLVSLASFAPNTPAFLMLRSGHPSFIVLPAQIVLPLVVVGIITMLGAWLPARRAARLRPVDALTAVH